MAYRFLLEVPEALAADANVAVAEANDAQVVLVRGSHGLGFDDAAADLTVAAHSLRVIETLYGWFDTLGASRPDIRIVLHGGDRLSLEGHDRGAMVAAIRRDQPWVERTLPKIGDHERDEFTPGFTRGTEFREGAERSVNDVPGTTPAAGAALDASWVAPGAVANPVERRISLRALNHVAVRVADLAKAERFYTEFFDMELLGRARRDGRGQFEPVDGDYRWDEALVQGTEADLCFLANGPIVLALHRVGRGARLDRWAILDHLSIAVDAITFTTLRGEVLMRSFETVATADTAITFRDPFGLTWEVTVQGTPGLVSSGVQG